MQVDPGKLQLSKGDQEGQSNSRSRSSSNKDISHVDANAWSEVVEAKLERWNERRTQNFKTCAEPLKELPETFFDDVERNVLEFPPSLHHSLRRAVYKAAHRLQMRTEAMGHGKYRRVCVYRSESPHREEGKPRSKKEFKKALSARLQMWSLGEVSKPQDLEIPLPELDGVDFSHNSSSGLSFPPTLSSYQRRMAHMAALKLGLFHASTGSQEQRRVIISKTEDFSGLEGATLPEKNSLLYDPSVQKSSPLTFWNSSDDSQRYREEMEKRIQMELQEMLTSPMGSVPRQCRDLNSYPTLEDRGYELVETKEALKAMVAHLDTVNIFGFDIEFHTYRSYYGITCLIQISTLEKNFVVDTFAVWDHVALLRPPFADPQKIKIGHDVKGSDAPFLFRDFGIVIVNIFDTHEAARELQYEKNGLSAVLLENGLGHEIYEKIQVLKEQHQVSDWRVRPLLEGPLVYAALDSHYLIPLYFKLRSAIIHLEHKEQPQSSPAVIQESKQELEREEKDHEQTDDFERPGKDAALTTKESATELEDIDEDEVLIPSEVKEDTDDDELWEGWGEQSQEKKDPSDIADVEEPFAEEIEERMRPADWPRGESFSSHIAQPRSGATTRLSQQTHPQVEDNSRDGQQRLREFMIRCQKGVSKLWKPKVEVGPVDYKKVKLYKYAKRNKKTWSDLSTAVFAELFQWRDRTARELDEGLHYLCSTETLVEIARKAPDDVKVLRTIAQPLSAALGDGDNPLGESLLQAVKKAKHQYEKEIVQHEKQKKNKEEKQKLKDIASRAGVVRNDAVVPSEKEARQSHADSLRNNNKKALLVGGAVVAGTVLLTRYFLGSKRR
mmetsp:Transcript_28590/g.37445  ORF Transcript_28590/g.37445 Transcript_28590/m.37445 type:complete len:839 (-) Transcript_28590:117-2633(-)